MNFCPPNPGSTVMIRTMSTRVTNGRTDSTGVFGLTPTPTFIPAFFICSINALGLSAWKRRTTRWKLVSKIIILQYFPLTIIRAYPWERKCKWLCNLICPFYKDNYCKLKEKLEKLMWTLNWHHFPDVMAVVWCAWSSKETSVALLFCWKADKRCTTCRVTCCFYVESVLVCPGISHVIHPLESKKPTFCKWSFFNLTFCHSLASSLWCSKDACLSLQS